MEKKYTQCMDLVQRDSQVYPEFARIAYYPLAVRRGHGAIIEDADGNEYIDLLSGAASLNTGHSHPRIVDAICRQAGEFISYTSAYTYSEPLISLGEALCRITPGDFPKKVAFGLSGSDANDGMIKLVRSYTGRRTIVSFIGGYHGSTYGALSLSAISGNMRRKIGPMISDIHHIRYPDCYRCPYHRNNQEGCDLACLDDFRQALASFIPADEVAAVVVEPIQGDGGLIVPPKKYIKALHELCQEHGILFVSEEVQQGFGRTGKWFGVEHFEVEPDVIVMGKSIASGVPLSAIVARREIMDALQPPAHLFSMSGNALSCAAALETIKVIEDEGLLERSRELGNHVQARFEEMKSRYDLIGDVRGMGLSIGVDLVRDRGTREGDKTAAAKICYRCWEKGVIVIFLANGVLRIQPPLVISKEELDQALDVIEESMVEYINGEISDDVLKVVKGW